ncbi:MAG TPA: hypothetical protein VKT77_16005 [Chthonomonadaceae bacterium]|nr:hypothetical protein [Chthonomonadaceae bacterium]
MQCPRCGSNNPEDNEFCDQCGGPLRPTDPGASPSSAGSPLGRTIPPLPGQAPTAQPPGAIPVLPPQPLGAPPADQPQPPAYQTLGAQPTYQPPTHYVPPVPGQSQVYAPPGQPTMPAGPAPGPYAQPSVSPPGGYVGPPPYGAPPVYPGGGQYSPYPGGLAPARDPKLPPPLPAFGALAASGYRMPMYTMCGVCGTALFNTLGRCVRCGTPPGKIINPNDPTATEFVPFGPHIQLHVLFRGGEQAPEVEERVEGWNWAAALLPSLWSFRHRIPWFAMASTLLTLVLAGLCLLRASTRHAADGGGTLTGSLIACALIFGLPRSLYLGRLGNTIAWRSGLYPDRDRLRKAQRTWTVWAIMGATVTALALAAAAVALQSAA